MSRFHPLRIARIERDTRDAVALTFELPPALTAAFHWQPGQHLTLRAEVDGADLRRSYSICTAPGDALRIGIKRAPGGAFSNHANDRLKAGDVVDVMPPMGHFALPPDASRARHLVAFAAGSGITPILGIATALLDAEPASRFTLFYGNRASSSVMFREALAALKDRHLTRFNLVHVLSRESQDLAILNGRIDAAKASALLDHWIGDDVVDAYYVCGPDGMMKSVGEALAARGIDPARIRVERFAASIPEHVHVPRPVAEAGAQECEVTAILDGVRRTFIARKGVDNLVDAGIAQGIDIPFSCKGGVCSTCRCRLVEGDVDMDVNFALEDYEVARGFRLACQSYAVSDRVVVDFDQTGTGID